jgi:plastocyanin
MEGIVTRIRRVVGTGFAIAVVAGSLPLAACGGGGGNGGGGDADLSGIEVEASRKTETANAEVVVEVKDNSFNPDTITIKTGTKVVWKWVGTSNAHSIQLSGNTSPEQSSGTYERVFDQTGSTFSYQCGVHKAAMTGKIVIE